MVEVPVKPSPNPAFEEMPLVCGNTTIIPAICPSQCTNKYDADSPVSFGALQRERLQPAKRGQELCALSRGPSRYQKWFFPSVVCSAAMCIWYAVLDYCAGS